MAAQIEVLRRHVGQAREMRDRVHHAERHDAAARRRVGGDEEAVERACCSASSRAQSVVRRLPAVQTCSAISRFVDDAREILVGHRDRAAVDVERDVGLDLDQMIAADRAGARDRRAAGVQVVIMPCCLRLGDHRRVVVGGLHRAEAGLGEPHALLRDLREIRLGSPGSRMIEPAITRMPPGR